MGEATSILPLDLVDLDDEAVSDGRSSRTWRALDVRSRQVANALLALGLTAGDRFAVLMRNRTEWVDIILGNLLAGTEYVPVNWRLSPAEVAHLIADSGATVLVHDGQNADSAAAVGAIHPALRLIDVDSEWNRLVSSMSEQYHAGEAAGGVLLYTGGTTGLPKAVIRSEVRSVPLADFPEFNRHNAVGVWHFPTGPGAHLVVCPMHHSAPPGLMTYSIFLGQRVHILDRFDPESTLAAIEREQISVLVMVPTQIVRMLRLPEEVRRRYDVSTLRYVVHGAAPCPQWARRELIEWFGRVVWEYYGAVEGTGPFLCSADEFLARPGTVGRPPSHFEVWVEDEDGRRLADGETGALWFRNQRGHPIYQNDPEKTADAVRSDGSYTIGDHGYFDADGYLFIVDRRTDMIVSGGVNIYPAEIESVLSEHLDVADVAVIGLPDDEWGQRLHAVVVPERGSAPTPEELDRHCRQRLAGFKCPRSFELVSGLARDESGKLRRRAVREGVLAQR